MSIRVTSKVQDVAIFHSFVLTYDAAQVTPQSGHRVGDISCWWPHHRIITITSHQITSHHHHITSHENAWLKPSHHVTEDDHDDDDEQTPLFACQSAAVRRSDLLRHCGPLRPTLTVKAMVF